MPSRTCRPPRTSWPWSRPRASGGSACTEWALTVPPRWPGPLSSCLASARSASVPSSRVSLPSPTCSTNRSGHDWPGSGERRGALVVEPGPFRAPAGLGAGDLPYEFLDELGLRYQQRQPVLLLHQEQLGHAIGERGVDKAADLGACLVQPGEPLAQQCHDL